MVVSWFRRQAYVRAVSRVDSGLMLMLLMLILMLLMPMLILMLLMLMLMLMLILLILMLMLLMLMLMLMLLMLMLMLRSIPGLVIRMVIILLLAQAEERCKGASGAWQCRVA